jgi:outer membrane protein OmpA-like peptidoglycan-associated protein
VIRARLRRSAAVAALGSLVSVVMLGGVDGAAATPRGDGDNRVRDLEFRVRDLSYRSNALDNSERVETTPDKTSVALSADVLFDYNKADLTSAANGKLDALADQLDELGPRRVTVAGHTDSDGDDAANQDLSERRAEAVRSALASRLDDGFTFEVQGYGETKPVAPNQTPDGADNPAGRALNRRVEVAFAS